MTETVYCGDCDHPRGYHDDARGCTMPLGPSGMPVSRNELTVRVCGCGRTDTTVPPGKAVGGFKSEGGKAAYWRLQWESAVGALADLIDEHRGLVESIEALIQRADDDADFDYDNNVPTDYLRKALDGDD